MRRRVHLRKKYVLNFNKKKSKINTIILLIIAIFVAVFLVFNYINKKSSPILLKYAELEANKLASLIVSKAITEEMKDDLDLEKLFVITKNDDGEVRAIDFNPASVNSLLSKATTEVHKNLKFLENGELDKLSFSKDLLNEYDIGKLKNGIIHEIPSGVVFGNSLLANLGPKIPVRFNLIGNIIANIETNVSDYGINNALIDVRINMKLTERVVLPVSSSSVAIEINVPIALKIIQGAVPSYYYAMPHISSSVTVPIE